MQYAKGFVNQISRKEEYMHSRAQVFLGIYTDLDIVYWYWK